MKVDSRIVAPILFAVFCSGLFVSIIGLHVARSKELFSSGFDMQQSPITPSLGVMEFTEPFDTSDSTLTYLRQGDLLALKGQWEEAQNKYKKAVEHNGGVIALRKLATAQLQRRDMRGVRSTISKLKRGGGRTEDVLLLESVVLIRTGELVQARILLEEAETSPQKNYGLALLSIVEGDHLQAQSELQLVIQGWEPVLRASARTILSAYDEYALFPESPNEHLITLIARSLAEVNECEIALPLLVQVTQKQDDYRDAWIVQGFCELITERPEQALTSFERAYNVDPEKPVIQYFLGRSYLSLTDAANAKTFFDYAVKNGFEPKEEAERFLLTSALQSGDIGKALSTLTSLSDSESATLEDFKSFMEIALITGNTEEAFEAATLSTQVFADNAVSFALLGKVLQELGRDEEADAAFTTAQDMDPENKVMKEMMGG